MKHISRSLVFIFSLFSVAVAQATNDSTADVKSALEKLLPGVKADSIQNTPIDGLFQVAFGPRVMYISEDGRYLIQGNMMDLTTRKNLTEPAQADAMLSSLGKVGEENMIVFKPEKEKYTATVFTDIDCGYCRKLHSQMDEYLAKGIKIRYLFFPRSGPDTESFNKSVSVWCADDRNEAMTIAKSGQSVESKTCSNPVRNHFELGMAMGVRGTPAIITDKGKLLPGYIPPDELAGYLNGH